MNSAVLHLGWALALVGCASTAERLSPIPELELRADGARAIEVAINGSNALRGLQATLRYDPQQLTITGVEPIDQIARLDRVFSADPSSASGALVFGVTDTRRVLLPAEGRLFLIAFAPKTTGQTKLQLQQAIGVDQGTRRIELADVAIEVSFQ